MSPRIFDCFMLFDEVDMLECRLTELEDVVDKFIIVECGHTHQGQKKESTFEENKDRFAKWLPKIEYVWIDNLKNTDAMRRDEEQRESFFEGLRRLQVEPSDLVIQSDLDEIPTAKFLERPSIEEALDRAAPQSNFLTFRNRFHCFAVDWEHPHPWPGSVIGRFGSIRGFYEMRAYRIYATFLENGGHHLTWLGPERVIRKLDSFAHVELAHLRDRIAAGENLRRGIHVDGVQMFPVDIDDTWPKFVRSERCPKNWFRPRN